MTDQEIENLLDEYHVPQHIRRHCRAVDEFAQILGEKLIAAGEKIDLRLLHEAALLHDIARVVDFRTFNPKDFASSATEQDISFWQALREKYPSGQHEKAGAEILKNRGEEKVAVLIERHRYLQVLAGFNSWEEKILYYADKRVKHDKNVPLSERLAEGQKRNAPKMIGTDESKKTFKKIYELEEEIFTKVGEKI